MTLIDIPIYCAKNSRLPISLRIIPRDAPNAVARLTQSLTTATKFSPCAIQHNENERE